MADMNAQMRLLLFYTSRKYCKTYLDWKTKQMQLFLWSDVVFSKELIRLIYSQ